MGMHFSAALLAMKHGYTVKNTDTRIRTATKLTSYGMVVVDIDDEQIYQPTFADLFGENYEVVR
jgi:hypothetical protein